MNVPSRTTSRHHWYIDSTVTVNPRIKHVNPCPWNQHVSPVVNRNAPSADVNGQGLGSTKWNGCRGII